MFKFITSLSLAILLSSCATSTTSNWEISSAKNEIDFVNGKITAIPQISHEHVTGFEFVTLDLKVVNTKGKDIEIDPVDVYVITTQGQVISQMTKDDVAMLSRGIATKSAIQLGFSSFNSGNQVSNAETTINQHLNSSALKKGAVPVNTFIKGFVYFSVPKDQAESITFKFKNSLASKEDIMIRKKVSSSNNNTNHEVKTSF